MRLNKNSSPILNSRYLKKQLTLSFLRLRGRCGVLALFAIHQQTGKAIAYCTSSPNSNPNQEDDSSCGHSSFTTSISGNDKN